MKRLLDDLCFAEGPRWRADEQRLWFSDMHDHRIIAVDLEGNSETISELADAPSGLGWLPAEQGGNLLVVSMVERKLLRRDDDGSFACIADLSDVAPYHCNDMVVDTRGNAYIGNFGFDLHSGAPPAKTTLVLVTAEGAVEVVADEMSFPNGSAITPDGRTLIVGETFASCLTAFDIESDGRLSNRRLWAPTPGAVPDGICLDAEGGIWLASPTSSEVVRVLEGGEVTDRIRVESQAFACMLGGPERRHLFVCTALDSDPEKCIESRSGCIEFVEVDVPGAGLP
ncbi:MAG: SMP-30/gluconolactonase/LRE family protein [Myxococcota bacterium]|nr:SMP-30/gluconolactonase/LRE family protein [Myxococcota bacterium]